MDVDIATLIAQAIITLFVALGIISPVANRGQKKRVAIQENTTKTNADAIERLGMKITDLTISKNDLEGAVRKSRNQLDVLHTQMESATAKDKISTQKVFALEARLELREEEAKKIPILEKKVIQLELKLDIATNSIAEKDAKLTRNAATILELSSDLKAALAVKETLENLMKEFKILPL